MNRYLMMGVAALCAGAAQAYRPVTNALMTVWGEAMTPETAWRDYPRPNLVRTNWQNLNGEWDYAIVDRREDCPAKMQGKILVPFAVESALSGVKRMLEPSERLWYRRAFTAAFSPGKDRVLLNFGGVDYRTQVFVNGREMTDVPHDGGVAPFSLDITAAVTNGVNELVVSVWDPTDPNETLDERKRPVRDKQLSHQAHGKQTRNPQGCFYTRVSGIWQTVWTEVVPETHITGYRVETDIDRGTVAVTLLGTGDLMNASATVAVRDGDRTIASGAVTHWGQPVTLTIPEPKLWSPETPNLYDLDLTLAANGATDRVRGYFGMRLIEAKPDECGVMRFYLNHEKTFFQGTLDQGWWPDGLLTPPSEEAMAFDIGYLKRVGFNMMRKHIKIEPLRYYYLCDKMGLVVFQDQPSGFGDPEARYGEYRRDLKEMIDLLQTFPCIVMWVPYNEGWGQPMKAKTNWTQTWVKNYDPTRLVNGPSGWRDYGIGDTRDMHKYPGPGMFPVMKDRISILGEFGGLGFTVKDHTWLGRGWGYVSDQTTEASFGRYQELMTNLATLAQRGLGASVYTQTTDVEAEVNGLLTYDRKVEKYSAERLRELHQRVYEAVRKTLRARYRDLSPTAETAAQTWRYVEERPAEDWMKPAFDDSTWREGAAGFGTPGIKVHEAARLRTVVNGKLWARRTFTFNGDAASFVPVVRSFYDEELDVYLNGVKLIHLPRYSTIYENHELDAKTFRAALKQGENVLAVSAVNKTGGFYVDVGLLAVTYE